jgi:excisionase family DNA binding protein
MQGSADDFIEKLVELIATRVGARMPQPGVPPPQSRQPEYLTTKQAAALLGLGRSTLEAWRTKQGKGPKHLKLPGPGGAVRYSRADLDAWLARHSR